jgi:hypothetical protein
MPSVSPNLDKKNHWYLNRDTNFAILWDIYTQCWRLIDREEQKVAYGNKDIHWEDKGVKGSFKNSEDAMRAYEKLFQKSSPCKSVG